MKESPQEENSRPDSVPPDSPHVPQPNPQPNPQRNSAAWTPAQLAFIREFAGLLSDKDLHYKLVETFASSPTDPWPPTRGPSATRKMRQRMGIKKQGGRGRVGRK